VQTKFTGAANVLKAFEP